MQRVFFIPTNDRAILAHRDSCFDADMLELTQSEANHRAIELARSSLSETGKKSRIFRQTAIRLWDLYHDAYDLSLWEALELVDASARHT